MLANQERAKSFLKFFLSLGFVIGVIAVLFVGSAVSAQTSKSETITLSPTAKQLELKPGTSKTETVSIINDGQTDYSFNVYARPFGVTSGSYTPLFEGSNPRADVNSWISFEKAKYTLKAGERTDVKYTIAVPQNATAGGHYGAVFAEVQPRAASGESVIRKKRVGAVHYITVPGAIERKASLGAADIPLLQTKRPLTATQPVKVDGNVHLPLNVRMKVSDLFGGVKYQKAWQFLVLPDTTRNAPLEWPGAPQFGLFKVSISSQINNENRISDGYVLMVPVWLFAVAALLVAAAFVVKYVSITRKNKPAAAGKK